MDINIAEPKYDVPLWNEARWNGCWNGEDGVGLYLHAGRYRGDIDLWWAQVAAFLPGRGLCVERLFGPNESGAGVRLGGLRLEMTEDGWTGTFDGVGQLTTVDALARAPRGSGAPLKRMRFDVVATAAAPMWDMYAGSEDRLDFAGEMHIQQGFTTTGNLSVAGEDHVLDGIGFKDHSSGPRDFSNWYAHNFFLIVTEEWTCHAVRMYTAEGKPMDPVGAFFRDDEQFNLTRFDVDLLADATGGPVVSDLLIETESGERLEYSCELVHGMPMTMTVDNDNINGIDWEVGDDPVVIIEGKGRLTAPNGSVAHCYHERSSVRSRLDVPRGALGMGLPEMG
jgi:hypothetical protein